MTNINNFLLNLLTGHSEIREQGTLGKYIKVFKRCRLRKRINY